MENNNDNKFNRNFVQLDPIDFRDFVLNVYCNCVCVCIKCVCVSILKK